ncbi:MAG TPA: hypothetical protein PLJ34_08340 [Hyphomicrobiales bacterium]|mgnify:CR=1 FL=1|nr:hypothetical protein [Kaistiaceae bacterium]HQF31442.1 hypothetical protein [Hyphomicrobiales bacterium]
MLSRLALRLAAFEALAPFAQYGADEPVWPTLADGRVYDTAFAAFDDLSDKEGRPIVAVYTEKSAAETRSGAGGDLTPGTVELAFELSVVRRAGQGVLTLDTDPAIEAHLDLLEAQVRHALAEGESGAIFRNAGGLGVMSITSEPYRSAEEATRLASRSLTYSIRARADCYASVAAGATGFDRLPQPLRAVAEALPEGSHGRLIAAQLAGLAPSPMFGVPLAGVGLAIHAKSPPAAYAGEGDEPAVVADVAFPPPDPPPAGEG